MLSEDLHVDQEMVGGEKPTVSGSEPTEVTTEPSMVSPRLIPAPDLLTNSGRPDPPPTLEDSGNSSASFDQKRAPSQAPVCESANCDHLSYDKLRNLCNLRDYTKKGAKVALETRLQPLDAVSRRPLELNENDMDTSSSVLGKRGRSMAKLSNIENSTPRVKGERSRRGAPATTLTADLAAVQARAQWGSPDL